MSKLIWLRSLFVPVIILSILFVAFAGYYWYWVPNRQRHLDDRGFRYLKTLSDQIRLTINTYDKMMDYALDSGVVGDSEENTKARLKQFLTNAAPQLDVPEKSETAHVIGDDYDDPPKFAVAADEGTHFLYLAFTHDREDRGQSVNFAVRTDLDKLINGLLGSPNFSPFDVVLVAQNDGKVVFQSSQSGIEVAQVKNLKDASGQAKVEAEKRIGIGLLSPTSRLEEVEIAGARYRLYSQPLQIGFRPANPNLKSTENVKSSERNPGVKSAKETPKTKGTNGNPKDTSAGKNPEPKNQSAERNPPAKSAEENPESKSAEGISDLWVLCGLVRADRFRSESQLIPYAYILMILAAILLAAASYPFLRLYLSTPGERLRARDVTITAVFACLVTAVLTFILADVYYWNNSFGPSAEEDMEKLAKAINANFKREQSAAFATLDGLNTILKQSDALKQAEAHSNQDIGVRYDVDSNEPACEPPWACEVNILTQGQNLVEKQISSNLKAYPYPFFAFWSDANDKQRIKWTTRKLPTPFIPLDDASTPYYSDVKRALKEKEDSQREKADSQLIPLHGIGTQYSATTGQNVTTFWEIMSAPTSQDGSIKQEDKKAQKYCASLVTQPISLYNSTLPGGYQFAVLTPDGGVVFHSDYLRNLRENFFAETDQNPDLRSRIRMRAAGPVVSDYMGHPHRMYILPMEAANQDGLWSIVIFRDLHLEETMNLEILSLVSIMFVLYAGAITLVLISANWIRKDQAARMWFWPDSRKAERYTHITIVNLVAAVLLLVLSRFVPPRALLLFANLIPVAILLSNLVLIAGRRDLQAAPEQPSGTMSTQWQFAYFGAGATLLMVVAVLPCLCFFKMAAEFEHRLFIEHTQLQLADDLETRALNVGKLYQDVNSGDYTQAIFAGPEDQHAGKLLDASTEQPSPVLAPLFSYHEFLNTSVCRGPDHSDDLTGDSRKTIPDCHIQGLKADGNSFLSVISLSYNEHAADDRHLAEGNSDVWNWTSGSAGSSRILKLTKQKKGEQARVIVSRWTSFQFPWDSWFWWFCPIFGWNLDGPCVLLFLAMLYSLVRLTLSRIFLFNLVAPPPTRDSASGLSPASLMADLPMNLLIIGPESCRPIGSLIHRLDVQVHEAEELLEAAPAEATPADGADSSKSVVDHINAIIRDGRPLVLRDFEHLPDDAASAAKSNAALMRVLSGLGNSVIIISDLDPAFISSIEASDRWRYLLRSFVRIDLNSKTGQRIDEDDADYQNRISADSYFHWLFSGLSKPEKLVMLQLAQEKVINPNSFDIISELMAQGMIERSWGVLTVKDKEFAIFLKHALPHHRVKEWEKQMVGTRPFSLQTSLLIVGIGVVAFLVYTQGEVFNTWVTYATGLAASVPKVLQLLDGVRTKSGAKA